MTRTEEHTTSEGAPAAATRWLRTLDAGDYVEAWKQLTPCLRLAWAQVWLWRNRHAAELDGHDLDEMAAAFAAPDPRHVRWPGFALGELGSLHDSLPRPAADYTDTKALALAMVVGVDLERVVIAPHGAALFPSRGAGCRGNAHHAASAGRRLARRVPQRSRDDAATGMATGALTRGGCAARDQVAHRRGTHRRRAPERHRHTSRKRCGWAEA